MRSYGELFFLVFVLEFMINLHLLQLL